MWSQNGHGITALLTCLRKSVVGYSSRPTLFCQSEPRRGWSCVWTGPRKPCQKDGRELAGRAPRKHRGSGRTRPQPLSRDVPGSRGHEGLQGVQESEGISLAPKVLCLPNCCKSKLLDKSANLLFKAILKKERKSFAQPTNDLLSVSALRFWIPARKASSGGDL